MKKPVIFIFAACTLFFSGCCTAPHAAKWEYKVATAPQLPDSEVIGQPHREVARRIGANNQEFLNELGKDGWVLVSVVGEEFPRPTFYYLRRPLK